MNVSKKTVQRRLQEGDLKERRARKKCIICFGKSIQLNDDVPASPHKDLFRSVFKFFRIKLSDPLLGSLENESFCEPCKHLCTELVNLYNELKDAQLNLNWKTSQLQNIIRKTKDVGQLDSEWNIAVQEVQKQILNFNDANSFLGTRNPCVVVGPASSKVLLKKRRRIKTTFTRKKNSSYTKTAYAAAVAINVNTDVITDNEDIAEEGGVVIKDEPEETLSFEFDEDAALVGMAINDVEYPEPMISTISSKMEVESDDADFNCGYVFLGHGRETDEDKDVSSESESGINKSGSENAFDSNESGSENAFDLNESGSENGSTDEKKHAKPNLIQSPSSKKKRRPKCTTSYIRVRKHDTVADLKCELCDRVFRLKKNLREHNVRTHGAPIKEGPECRLCSERFLNIQEYKTHRRKFHKNQLCSECGETFSSPYFLIRHIKRNHSEKGTTHFNCLKCKRKFITEEKLEQHKIYHVDEVEKPHGCDHCEVRFKEIWDLDIHNKLHPFKCVECGKVFERKSYLTKHLDRIHQLSLTDVVHGKGREVCQFPNCGKEFKSHTGLMTHVGRRLHYLDGIGPKRLNCPQCDKRFIRKQSLIAHCAKHHPENNYPVDFRPQTSTQKDNPNNSENTEATHSVSIPLCTPSPPNDFNTLESLTQLTCDVNVNIDSTKSAPSIWNKKPLDVAQ